MTPAGIPTEILVCPDSFKGTFAAAEVAAAIARGLTAAGREPVACPLADGGEGTLLALAGPLSLELVEADVHDPVGRPIRAAFGLGDRVAVVELAAASGLHLVAEAERDPVAASTAGTGEVIAAALEAGARTVYVGAGGSATTDGGRGAIEALAAAGRLDRSNQQTRVIVLCDVRTPFESAARVFGPQKGADPQTVETLSRRLEAFSTELPRDPRGVPMTGAAGGFAGGLWAAAGAELVPGAGFVLEAIGFDARMRAARAIVTGEGSLDRSSLVGKVVGEVATRARQAGVPAHAIVGRRRLDLFDQRILDLQVVLEATSLEALEAAGVTLAGRL